MQLFESFSISGTTSLAAAIEQLPYQFKDPHKLDKKTDPRKLTFGSRIEKGCEAER